MPPRPNLPPGQQFVTRDGIELMISQALSPIREQLAQIKSHGESFYGNGSGRKGKLEEMEEKQDERWEDQKEFKKTVLADLSKLTNTIVSGTAVAKDRRWWIGTAIAILAVLADIILRINGQK